MCHFNAALVRLLVRDSVASSTRRPQRRKPQRVPLVLLSASSFADDWKPVWNMACGQHVGLSPLGDQRALPYHGLDDVPVVTPCVAGSNRRAFRQAGRHVLLARNPCPRLGARFSAPRAAIAEPTTDAPTQCPRGPSWEVHKFGGTCLATPERIRDVAKLGIEDPAENKILVVSAMGSHPTSPTKVTDLILRMIDKAAKQDVGFMMDLAALQEKHVNTARVLLGDGQELNQFIGKLMDDVADMKAMLQAISIGRDSFVEVEAECILGDWGSGSSGFFFRDLDDALQG